MKEVYLDSVGVVIVLSLYHTSLVIEYPYFPAKSDFKTGFTVYHFKLYDGTLSK
jgi:hypothetical protein